MSFKKRYRDLEMEVYSALRTIIEQSDVESIAHDTKIIPVNIFDCTALGIIDGRLTFLDDRGLTYSINNGDCSLEDLIDIYNNYLGI
jgi:hypothetical protein